MPVLTESLCPQLTSDIITQCKKVGVQTVSEFVCVNTEELAKKTKIVYKDLMCIRHVLLSNYVGFPQRADGLYNMLLETVYIINTGSKSVNCFLKGGIYTGEVTEIYGSAGAGKTQFCMCVAANLVSDSDSSVLYLDTNCNFSASRVKQILSKYEDKLGVTQKMQKIRIINVHDIYSFFDVLDCVKSEISNMENLFFRSLKLMIIDSIAHLLSPCFGGKYLDGVSFLNNIAQLFKRICSGHKISILVSNNTVQSNDCDIKAALGHSWKYVPSVSLCIRKVDEAILRKLSAVKSCRSGLHNEIMFNITESGISDRT